MIRLHAYFRSSTSFRVRIALNLKGVEYSIVPVNLVTGEHREEAFIGINPSGCVPVLELDGQFLTQSLAIIEWLDETYSGTPLLPSDIWQRFTVREAAGAIATELHAPLNLQVLQYLKKEMGHDQETVNRWYHHWLSAKLVPLERKLEQLDTADFLLGGPGLFECVLIPQLYNARRFAFDLEPFPRICRIESACIRQAAFIKAHPSNQPDFTQGNKV
jgi:maleylacetoacetate isomerase